jgi:hypothetical protein
MLRHRRPWTRSLASEGSGSLPETVDANQAWKQNRAAVKQHSQTCYVQQKEEWMQKQRDYRLLQKELRESARVSSAETEADTAARASTGPAGLRLSLPKSSYACTGHHVLSQLFGVCVR